MKERVVADDEPRGEKALALLLAVAVAGFFAWSRLSIATIPSEREYDEGVYLLSARALLHGQRLFTDVFSSQPPAFLESLRLMMRLFGDSLLVGRATTVAFSIAAMTLVADVARKLGGSMAAAAGVVALAVSVSFVDLGHVVQAETPATTLALASMACCLQARCRGWNRGWLAACGALFALALLFKIFVAPMALPVAFLLLLRPAEADAGWELEPATNWRIVLRRLFWTAACGLLLLVVPLLLYDARAMLDQTLWFHVAKYQTYELRRDVNLRRALRSLLDDAPLLATAVPVLLALLLRRNLLGVWLLLWFGSAMLALVQQTPLFWRHFVLLSPPLALAAALAPSRLFAAQAGRRAALALLLGGAWIGGALALSDRSMFPLVFDRPRYGSDDNPLRLAVQWLERHTNQDDVLVSDDPIVVFLAGRRSPPGLCDTSQARIATGWLSLQQATSQSRGARIVLLRKNGRLSSLTGYLDWLETHYEPLPPERSGLGPQRSPWLRRES